MNRIVKFTATELGAVEAEFALVIGFALDVTSKRTESALTLQRAKEGSVEDEGIYVEIGLQDHACYDGIKDAMLEPGRFTISFTSDARPRLGGIGGMDISFQISASEFGNLADIMRRVFRNHGVFSIKES